MTRHIAVRVVPEAAANKVEQVDDTLKVYTKSPARNGRANQAIVSLVQAFLATDGPVRIVAGHKQANKILEIPD